MNQDKNIAPKTETAAESTTTRPVVAPAVDIYENEREYLVLADLPGVANDGVRHHRRVVVTAAGHLVSRVVNT